MGKIIKGFWDCTQCGTKKIGADEQVCPNCGKARDKDFKPYIDEGNIQYLSEEEAEKVSRKPDWLCDFCCQYNPDELDSCAHCGAHRLSENKNYFEVRSQIEAQTKAERTEKSGYINNLDGMNNPEDISYSLSDEWENMTDNSRAMQNEDPENESCSSLFHRVSSYFKSHSFRDFLPHIGIATLLASFIVLMVFLLTPKEMKVSVSQINWKYDINIERFQTVSESDWVLPMGARLRYSQDEYYGKERVIDYYETKTCTTGGGRRSLGNGYFEELETKTETYTEAVYKYVDVYKTKYYYDIDKWLYERTVRTSGVDHSPYWGDVNLSDDERVASSSEVYTITGRNEKEKDVTISLSYEDWMKVNVDQKVKLRVVLGHGEILE